MKISGALINRAARSFMNSVNMELIPRCLGEFSTIDKLLRENRDFKGFFMNPLFTPVERDNFLDFLKSRLALSNETIKFIRFIVDEKAIAGLSEIINKIMSLYFDKKRKAKATVITPISLDSRYDERLKITLKNLTGREIDIDYRVDPSLLGGIVIKVGSTMYDSSLKGQLWLLKDNLIKGELS